MFTYRNYPSVRGLLLLLLILLLVLAGCTRPLGPVGEGGIEPLGPVAPQAPVPETQIEPEPGIILTAEAARAGDFIIGVGIIRSMGEQESPYADSLEQGVRLAVDQINNQDYMGAGRRMAIMFGEAAVTGEVLNQPLEKPVLLDSIVAAVGPVLQPGDSDAAEDVMVPLVLFPAAGAELFDENLDLEDWLFQQPAQMDTDMTVQAVLAAREQLGVNRVGLVYPTAALEGVQSLMQGLDAAGIEIVATPSFDEGLQLTDILERLQEARPDAVVLYVPPEVVVEILTLLQEASFAEETHIILGAGLLNPELVAALGDTATGLIGVTAWHQVEAFVDTEAFGETYQQTFAVDADPVAARAYTAIWMLAEAIRTANTTDPVALREALMTVEQITTPFGEFQFPDPQAQLRTPIVLEVREGGEFAPLGGE
jgi:branched-chain amino acid transport system substrate-binding protein